MPFVRCFMSEYYDEVCKAMKMLSDDPKTIFMGQAVQYQGTAMFGTLKDVLVDKRLELPVAEDMQLGMAIGMSLNGMLPIAIYPRFNFLLLATNQLVLHLDKIPIYSNYRPKVLIRTAIATDSPLNPGHQHLGDFTEAYRRMLCRTNVIKLENAEDIMPAYEWVMKSEHSSVVVEMMEKY